MINDMEKYWLTSIFIIGFGIVFVYSEILVPLPPAKIIIFIIVIAKFLYLEFP